MNPIHKVYPAKSISVKSTSPLSDDDLRDLIEFRRRGMNDPSFEMLINHELPRLVTASEAMTRIFNLIKEKRIDGDKIAIEDLEKVILGD